MKYDHVAQKARIALTVALGIFSLYPLGHLQAQTANSHNSNHGPSCD